jgi:hypothetical protein
MNSPQSIQQILRDSAEKERLREAEELRDQYVRIFSGIYDRAAAYTQVLITVGYAATFGVWAFVREEMSARHHAASGLLLLTSVVVFVLWEVWANLSSVSTMRRLSRALLGDPSTAVQGMRDYERALRERGVQSVRSWAVAVTFCLVTGVMALGIMVWSLGRALLETFQ